MRESLEKASVQRGPSPEDRGPVPPPQGAWLVAGVVAVLAIATTAPYVVENQFARGRWFPAAPHSVSDYGVYLAWMRMARDGAWRDSHAFNGAGPPGLPINPVYFIAGWLSRWSGASLPVAYHAERLALVFLFVVLLQWFLRIVFQGRAGPARARRWFWSVFRRGWAGSSGLMGCHIRLTWPSRKPRPFCRCICTHILPPRSVCSCSFMEVCFGWNGGGRLVLA